MSARQVNSPSSSLSEDEVEFISDKLVSTPMFRRCHRDDLNVLAKSMTKVEFNHNDFLISQNQPAEDLLVISSGEARRTRVGRDGVERHVEDTNTTVNALTVTSGKPVYAAAKCISESCSAFALHRSAFRDYLASEPRFATDVVESLSEELRSQTLHFRTPLLAQRTNEVNYAAVAVAATVESYYRSALNAILNRQLTGNSAIPLFPSMQVQVPARVSYIMGFKSLRAFFERYVDPDVWSKPSERNAIRFFTTIAPGITMTPIASLLEACNVGHVNPEPLMRRAARGLLPRAMREIIFGVGLNQLSDYFEERYRDTLHINPVAANSLGSVTAGVAAGYFSHVPHNISTMRMLHPTKSYGQLFQSLIEKSPAPAFVTRHLPSILVRPARAAWACLFPKGVLTRTVQICGSFTILNGIILLIEGDIRRRMRKAIESANESTDRRKPIKGA